MASTVWRGYITFGLISIPVRLFRAARAERVGLRRLAREEPAGRMDTRLQAVPIRATEPVSRTSDAPSRRGETPMEEAVGTFAAGRAEPVLRPVRQISVRDENGELLPERSLVKGYEYEKGRYVVIEPEELKSLAPKTSSGMEIQEFVSLAEIDPVYFETSYYVTPEEAGEKAYALLYRSMQTTGLVAIAQFAMHTREHVVVVRPGKSGLLAHTMFFATEVKADEEYRADLGAVGEKELGLAETLIRSLAAPFEPVKYRDTYKERLESIIAKKVQGQPVSVSEAPESRAAVVDIAEALRKSLANLKKPVASEAPRTVEPSAPAARRGGMSAGNRGKKTSRGAAEK